MAKPKLVRIVSDDCAITAPDGAVYHPHEGEWVELFPIPSIGELQAFESMRRLGVEMEAVKGEPDEAARVAALLDPHFEQLCTLLAVRLVDWDWTDDAGRPLPKPTTATLKLLRSEELYWLLNAQEGETPAQRKNA